MIETRLHTTFGAPAEPDVKPAPPEVEEVEEEDTGDGTDDPWFVILFNDEVHTFEEVIEQLVKATGCSRGFSGGRPLRFGSTKQPNKHGGEGGGAWTHCLGHE
ncbi:MAG: hypothetical protein BRD31_06465 [Bacteroidetes bacterium QH_2_64_26]|nr:MAG: hypothetical protein BRD31_06465 [Bacteroidetes bacterium QH_2_64_26]